MSDIWVSACMNCQYLSCNCCKIFKTVPEYLNGKFQLKRCTLKIEVVLILMTDLNINHIIQQVGSIGDVCFY